MSRAPAGKRPGGRTSGTNTLITAASLALTLSGWAGIALSEADPPQQAISAPAPTPVLLPTLPALPTLVPTPDWERLPTRVQVQAASAAPTDLPAAPPPQVEAAPAAPAAPPAAVTVTRSSR